MHIAPACINFFHIAFAQVNDCQHSSLGKVWLEENGQAQPNSQGIVVVCIKDAKGQYLKAAFCYGGQSTFNEGAAAATCRQVGYTTAKNYSSGSALVTNDCAIRL